MSCRYRPCAGGVIFNSKGQVLVGERVDKPGQWQFPQGGLDKGENEADAARREVWEEIGLKEPEIEFVKTLKGSIK